MRTSSAGWSVVLYPGASYLHPSGQAPLRITNIHFKEGALLHGEGRSVVKVAYASDDSGDSDDGSSECSSSEAGIAEVVVAALTPNRIERAVTNFELTDDVDFVSLSVTGFNPVEIVGHYIVEEDEEEEDECAEVDPYDLLPETPRKYDDLFKQLESVLDAGLLAKHPELLKSVFGIETPPPEAAFWSEDPFNYDFLSESPAQFSPGTTFLPDKPIARSSSPPAPSEQISHLAQVKWNRYALPAHLHPPTPPDVPASKSFAQGSMDWSEGEMILTRVKAEEESSSAGWLEAYAELAQAVGPLPLDGVMPQAKLPSDEWIEVLAPEVEHQVREEIQPRPNKRQREERARAFWRGIAIGF